MSADNFIGVLQVDDGWIVEEGSMSFLFENKDACIAALKARGGAVYKTPEEASDVAFKMEQSTAIVEYGVILL